MIIFYSEQKNKLDFSELLYTKEIRITPQMYKFLFKYRSISGTFCANSIKI